MTKPMRLSILACLLCAACAETAPPDADPANVERFLASLEAEEADDAPVAEMLGNEAEAKVEKADRMIPAVAKVPVEKIDPAFAAGLIGG